MSCFDYVFMYKTNESEIGIVRGDNISDATERVESFTGSKVEAIINLNLLENHDYGVISFNLLDYPFDGLKIK